MESTHDCRTMAVANEKGGVGKTVMAVNLGAAFSLKGKAVLIVDADPQANATRGLGIEVPEGAPTLYDLMKDPAGGPARDCVLKTRWDRLDVLPATVDLAGAEVELVDEQGREYRLKDALEGLWESYDVILIDTPPSLSLLTVNVFACAAEVLVPCQTHPYAYAALEELFDTVSAIQKEINPELTVTGIVATFFDARTRVSHQILEKLKSHPLYGPLLLKTPIRINTTIADSALVGKPVLFYRKRSYGAVDFMQLAEELLEKGP